LKDGTSEKIFLKIWLKGIVCINYTNILKTNTLAMRKSNSLRLLSLLVASFLFIQNVFAQSSVTGTVTDQQSGKGIPSVSVSVKGSNVATLTDNNGTYRINVPSNGTLVFTSIGYETIEMPVSGRSTVDVAMTSANAALSEVVVIGYGTARKRDVTGSVSLVQEKNFNKGIVTTPDQLIQNKVPGLQVTSNSGQPGSATTVKIRGNNSIHAVNNPLYVIDGVPLDGRYARPNFGNGTFGSVPDANPLIFINPYDIQSISVLKDASSAAIYGSRGANGVIEITTKTGSAGTPRVEFNTNVGVNAGLMKRFEVLDAGEFRSALKKYNISGQDNGATVDAQEDIMNKKLSQNYNLALAGGSDNGKYRASFLASTVNGYIQNSNLDKYIGSLRGQYKFLDRRLSIDFGLIAAHTKENLVAVSNTAGSTGNIISSILQWNPTTAYTDAGGNFIYPANGSGNPKALLDGVSDVASVNTVLGNIAATVNIVSNLDYKFMFAIENGAGTRNTNFYGFLQGYSGLSGNGFGAISAQHVTSKTFTHTLNYNTNLTEAIRLDALLGYEYIKRNFSNNNFSALGFNTNLTQSGFTGIPYTSILQNGNTQNPPSVYVDPTNELQSYFGRLQFNYSSKYYLTATMRADGSSKFGKNNKYGYFPSIAAKWVISNEDFMKGGALSNLALRASWGITGNQEFPSGASQEQFAFGSYNNASQINVANPDLKWEQTKSIDVGLDVSTAGGRISGSIDYYKKNTSDILFQSTAIQPAPASIYFINLPANLINRGVEVSLDLGIIDQRDFSWDLGGYYAYNKNNLENFTQNGKDIQILTGQINGQGVSGTLGQVITNNYPVNEYYLKPFEGFDQNGNQIIGADPIFAGNPNPTSSYGFNTTLHYKKLNFIVNGGGDAGYLIYNNTATSVTNISGIANGRNIDRNAYNSAETPTSAVGASTRFLEKGNYFKLRNVTLSYEVGNIGKYIKGLNAFITGNNLLVITKFSGFDPEVNIDKSNNNYPSRSIEYIPYPTARTISVGLNFFLQ
jgi:TonB-linked SusC/RagA family outer membrane protein